LHIMVADAWEGKGLEHPEVRRLFTREALLSSDWYAARLAAKQQVDVRLWRRHVEYLQRFRKKPSYAEEALRLDIPARLELARAALKDVESPEYLTRLEGTLGVEPIEPFMP
jgi:phosphoenolpyruvate carboxykinase (diphosphate)